ncbi:exopolysaccharide biosynthesis polyprenyl glycosylphosphotransferase [Spirosoma sp. BT702]|uniref:Exopolysaccharide biosynthesis polyprenyl glycosylphosphotransferase n=1 Tax=Spirosoma profusum TaxID=2771354 RepID=A0A927AVE9_9BACT|nr:exopolysaccharide biosynthesis polyprenyl glycosylphosphotransferase [Spirosoma profusum]MBD2705106.1 exopolysaccharide biosynthesis polyprenyl glycosylphosphotransferase [Spirosoma profusum]
MRHRYSILFFPLHVFVDFLSLNVAFVGAYWLKFKTLDAVGDPPYASIWILFNLTWLAEILISKPYIFPRQLFKAGHLLKKLLVLTAIHMAIISMYWVAIKGYYYSREHLLITYGLFLTLGATFRIGGLLFLKEYRARGYNNRRYVIAGYGKLAENIRSFYDTHPEMGFSFQGYFDQPNSENEGLLKGHFNELPRYVKEASIDCIYCCMPYIESTQLKRIVDHAEEADYQVKLLVDFRGFFSQGISIEYYDFLPILNLSSEVLADFRINFFKRCFDILFASTVLLLGSPVFIGIALATKFTSKGPVIFTQKRYGRLGKAFTMYKFRSMYTGSELILSGSQHSQGKEDPRITPWGGIMRRTRLDELPQFFNVLLGEMSIVGPRPLAEYDVETLMEEVPIDFQKILTVKPGITSIGQVKFGYAVNLDEMRQRLSYDLLYPERRSFLFDMWIIAQTVKVMIQGRGK